MPDRFQGRRIGRYAVRRRLGAGGFARVYLGFDPDLEFEVAIKVLKAQFAEDPDAVERFRREATTAVRLRHPNVVTVLTVGRLEEEFDGSPVGGPYLVMDYLPDSLTGRLEQSPALPEEEVRRIGAEVARGLGYAHQAGVVHRDVKPDNILFGRDGQAVVTDFGIARAVADTLSPITRSAVVGTPSYFSPEQARGLPLDGRTDVYALGVTLYQAATGALPFTGDDWYSVMRQHVEDPPPPPSSHNRALSPELDAIILRCLAKDPNARFASAGELADVLAGARRMPAAVAALESGETHATVVVEPYRARNASTASGFQPERSRRRWLVAGVVLGGVIAGGAMTMFIRAAMVEPPAPLPGPAAADTGATIPSFVRPPASAGVFGSSQIGELTDSILTANALAELSVSAPGAAIRVDGISVGRNAWRADTMEPGTHEIRATVPSSGNCPSADTTVAVTLRTRGVHDVRLRPRGCGTISITTSPSPARFQLRPVGGGPERTGMFPVPQPLVVPAGRYRLVVSVPTCQAYDDEVVVSAGNPLTKTIKLLCG